MIYAGKKMLRLRAAPSTIIIHGGGFQVGRNTDGDLDFLAAYNPIDSDAAHGFSRRLVGGVNLGLGTAATCSSDSVL